MHLHQTLHNSNNIYMFSLTYINNNFHVYTSIVKYRNIFAKVCKLIQKQQVFETSLKIGFSFKIDYGYRYCFKDHLKISSTTRSKILPCNWGKNNIPKCYHRRAALFLCVLSVKTAFREFVVFFFLKKIITLNIKGSLNMTNK